MIGKKVLKYIEQNSIVFILLSALFFRLFIANFGTLELDHGTFVAWGNNLLNDGFKNFYNNWSDYFPGYLYFLYGLAKINTFIPDYTTILFKLPAIVSDILVGLLIFKIVEKHKNKSQAYFSSVLYLFNPAVFYNSSLWGQADGLVALFTLLTLYVFNKNIYLSAVTLAIGTLIKPQAAFILPAIIYLFLVNKKSLKSFISYGLVSFTTFVAGFLPFNNKSNLYEFILDRINVSANQYPYGSVNAFSFWGVFGFWKPDANIVYIGLALSILIISVLSVILIVKKPKAGEYLLSAVSLLTTFLFMTRMHERHLLPVLAPLLVVGSLNYLNLASYFVLSLTYVANLQYAFVWITKDFKEIFNPTLIKMFIILNIVSFATMISSIYKKLNKIPMLISSSTSNIKNSAVSIFSKDINVKRAKILLILIVVFNLVTRFYSLSKPDEMYFDEIYHAFTAKLVLHNDPKAWEWWNPHPEGYAYEWTHPPLSKLGMALSMKIFGENPLGWRIPQAILGTLSILVVYLLAYEVFRDRKLALLSSFILSLDGLLLVLSRMGMNDTYVLFFTLLSVLLFIKDKNLLSSIAFGLAISSKWSAIYTLPILFIAHFVFKKKLSLSYLSFVVFPLVVYVASYTLMFTTGHTWSQFVEVQKQMWWYHTNLDATHPYTSPAWSWPILLRPIYLYDGGVESNITSRIYAFGNPFVFWFGALSIILSIFISAKYKFKKLGFIIFSYLVLFLPWIASPRIMFLYHYLPSIPYMVVASAFIMRKYNKLTAVTLVIMFLSFVYFYPHWTGLKVPLKLDESYYWFSSWR